MSAARPQSVEVEELQVRRNGGMNLNRKSEKGWRGGCGLEQGHCGCWSCEFM